MAVSKSKRFEVFKRDNFTCQYCGRKPPSVVLECDHLKPRASGGDDEMINLVTSCFDCNRGKRDTELDDTTAADLQNNEAERLIQQVALNELLIKLGRKKEKQFLWMLEEVERTLGFGIVHNDLASVRMFFDRTTVDCILRAARTAASVGTYKQHRWKAFCSQCWKSIKGEI